MLPGRHLAPKTFTAVNYCGRQLARRLRCFSPVYHKWEGATLYPGVHNHSLQYGGTPDWRFGMQVGALNFGSLSGQEGEELRKRMIYVFCLQEV